MFVEVETGGKGSDALRTAVLSLLKPSPRPVRWPLRPSGLGSADNHAANVLPLIREIKRAGATTLRGYLTFECGAVSHGARWALVRNDREQCVGAG